MIQEQMIRNQYVFRPPFSIGEFFVREYDTRDSKRSSVTHAILRGKAYKLFWAKDRMRLRNTKFYNFHPKKGKSKAGILSGTAGLKEHLENIFLDIRKPTYFGYTYRGSK